MHKADLINLLRTDKSSDWSEEIAYIETLIDPNLAPTTYEAEAAILMQRRDERIQEDKQRPYYTVPRTAYDTGEVYEPKVWPTKDGRVDFDNEFGETVFTLFAHPSPVEPEAHSIVVDGGYYETIRFFVNDVLVWQGKAP